MSAARPLLRRCACAVAASLLAACSSTDHIGKPPSFSPVQDSTERRAMLMPGLPATTREPATTDHASLWHSGKKSLLGDRRAMKKGDILTVVVEIDDKAEFSNTTSRSRSGAENMGVPQLLGVPQRIDERLPAGASMAEAVALSSNASSSGDGSVRRNESLELRLAATVVDVLPNGVLSISGSQEVRVNFEMRELLVSGFVRPEDITRRNEVEYDKIASARVSYGGRGQITDVQQPRYGQQLMDMILPF